MIGLRRCVCAGALVLAGCGPFKMSATRALMDDSPSYGEVSQGYEAKVLDVRGRMDVPASERRLAVDVRVEQGAHGYLPLRLHAYAKPDGEGAVRGTLVLGPESTRRRWPEDFVPTQARRRAMAMRVQDASYFKDGKLRADLVVTGEVAIDAVVVEEHGSVPTVSAQARRSWEAQNLPEPLLPLLRGFAQHSWGALLHWSRSGDVRVDPIAWLGPEGRPVAHATLARAIDPFADGNVESTPAIDPDACSLLVRVVVDDGEVRHLRVPIPLLREGVDLMLWREADVVRWTRREVWMGSLRAEPGVTAQWTAPEVRLAQTRLVYGWDDVYQRDQILRRLAQIVFAPATVAIDVLAATSPMIQALVELVVGPDESFAPPKTRR